MRKNHQENLAPGLIAAAKLLQSEGQDASASAIIADCLPLCLDAIQLQMWLEAAASQNDLSAIERCIDHAMQMPLQPFERQAVLDKAHRAKFTVQSARHMDTTSHYRILLLRNRFHDAQRLIYAPIDLNAVDGSSIWMASMIRMLSRIGKIIVISQSSIRRDAVVGDLISSPNVLFITPGNTAVGRKRLSLAQCSALIRDLDNALPRLNAVIVRGLAAVEAMLSDRQLYNRVYAYLTDIYGTESGSISVRPEAAGVIDIAARQAAGFLVQTPGIKSLIERATPIAPKVFYLPPPVPDELVKMGHHPTSQPGLRIAYAGKIAPQWGIRQLAHWVKELRASGIPIEVTIIGDKVSGAGDHAQNLQFRQEIDDLLEEIGAKRLGALERGEVASKMQEMDFAWCWRPPEFENSTLELSTKLIENVIGGVPSIAYPSEINVSALGSDYPFFARSTEDFRNILRKGHREVPSSLRIALHDKHSFERQTARLKEALVDKSERRSGQLVAAGHDFKFCHPYLSLLKKAGCPITLDQWQWGSFTDESSSRLSIAESDVLFCEWGLANAVWYAQNKQPHQRLVVRVHAQEVRPRAQKFGHALDHDKVDCFVFVTDWVRRQAIQLFGWPEEKTMVIPNFLLEDEYAFQNKAFSGTIHLGMVGIIPSTKRLDRAVDLLEQLIALGQEAMLHLKGPMPQDLPFMRAPGRIEDLKVYDAIFARVENSPTLRGAVQIHSPGNDVAQFYGQIDHILSPSETESFHYALADGVLSGCHPIVWEREDAARIFSPEWIVHTAEDAAQAIIDFRALPDHERQRELLANRNLLVSRYGSSRIFSDLDQAIFGNRQSHDRRLGS
ncbi:glycosyltransferase [Erythrobacter sp. A30-3]|nr:glycosyltransferase [Erythrobacter sp. A30-3]